MASYKEMIEFLVHSNVSGICITKYDCAPPDQECCMNQCVGNNNCFGMECSLDSQCGYSETCCRGSCSGHCDSLLPLILICVFTALFVICLITGAVWLYRRRTRIRQLCRRSLVSHRTAANARQRHYGGTQQSYLPPYIPSTTYRQEDLRFGPSYTTYSVPSVSRHPSQGCHAVPVRGVPTVDQPPPYSSCDQVTQENKNDRRDDTRLLDTERAAPSAPLLTE